MVMLDKDGSVSVPRRYVPKHGWTCFHCDETFKSERDARTHFGDSERDKPACQIKAGAERGLVDALRRAEADAAEAWSIIHDESSQIEEAYRQQGARHSNQLRLMEELGYERGLRDGLRMTPEERAKMYADA